MRLAYYCRLHLRVSYPKVNNVTSRRMKNQLFAELAAGADELPEELDVVLDDSAELLAGAADAETSDTFPPSPDLASLAPAAAAGGLAEE